MKKSFFFFIYFAPLFHSLANGVPTEPLLLNCPTLLGQTTSPHSVIDALEAHYEKSDTISAKGDKQFRVSTTKEGNILHLKFWNMENHEIGSVSVVEEANTIHVSDFYLYPEQGSGIASQVLKQLYEVCPANTEIRLFSDNADTTVMLNYYKRKNPTLNPEDLAAAVYAKHSEAGNTYVAPWIKALMNGGWVPTYLDGDDVGWSIRAKKKPE